MNKYNKIIGNYGEQLACNYLSEKGYKIIGRNVQTNHKEIDIISTLNELLVFTEVKTRTSNILGNAEDMLSGNKLKNLKSAIAIYLNNTTNKYYKNIRLDFIAININKEKKNANIIHYKDIF